MLGIAGGGEVGHQDPGRILRRSGFLRGLRRLIVQVAVQDHGHLGAGGIAGGIKAAVAAAGDDAVGGRPVDRLNRIAGNSRRICEISIILHGLAAVIPPQNGGDLLAGHRIIEAEPAIPVPGDDAAGRGPGDAVGVGAGGGHIRKRGRTGDLRAAGGTVQNGGQHPPGHGAVRRECGGSGAVHDAVVPAPDSLLRVPGAGVHIREAGVLHGGEGRDGDGQGQDGRRDKGGQFFQIPHDGSLLLPYFSRFWFPVDHTCCSLAAAGVFWAMTPTSLWGT